MKKKELLAHVMGIFADAGDSEAVLQRLEQELLDLDEQSRTLVALADKDGRDLTDDELKTINDNKAAMEKKKAQIDARKSLVAATKGPGRQSAPSLPNGNAGRDLTPKGNAGFKTFGEYAQCVHAAVYEPHKIDQRLVAIQSTFGNEAAGADGGWAVPPTWLSTIWKKVLDEENLVNRCTPLITGGNSIGLPKDETTPWGTAGVRVYWEAEGAQATASKPVLEISTMRLCKLMGLVPMSEEVMSDAPGLESYLMALAPGRMASKINEAIVAGTGAGQPLGVLKSPALVSVAKETSQPADSIWANNISKMYSRMYAPLRSRGVWLVNPDVEELFDQMAFPGGTVPSVGVLPVYMPPGGLSAAPYGTLKGRPVVPIEACSALGDQGDIIFVDLTQYWYLTKSGGMQTDVSMHLYFDQALLAFRFILRINGQPIWNAAITPKNSSNLRSFAVTLDERA